MRHFEATSANVVWQKAASELIERPEYEFESRTGATCEILRCVLTIKDPRQRWLLSRRPPYNPAFGLVEFVWIITGNNESKVLNYWNPGLPKYSGVDSIYHGAYGFRLRHEFGIDQIKRAYQILSSVPETRQVILQIWGPELDLPVVNGNPASNDIPCNVMSLLKLRNGRLYWSQIMRSNDIMRGLPYNIIQFTMLQEVMAGWLGSKLGDYFHLSDSLHLYKSELSEFGCSPTDAEDFNREPFSMTYHASEELFSLIYDDLTEVSNGHKTEDELCEIFHGESVRNAGRCELIKDMMAVIGSDAARRQNYRTLAYHLIDSCTDPNLKRASRAWIKHWEGRR